MKQHITLRDAVKATITQATETEVFFTNPNGQIVGIQLKSGEEPQSGYVMKLYRFDGALLTEMDSGYDSVLAFTYKARANGFPHVVLPSAAQELSNIISKRGRYPCLVAA